MPYTPDSFSDGQVLTAAHTNKLGTQYGQAMADVAASYASQASLTANYYDKATSDSRYLAVGTGTVAGNLTFPGNLTFQGTTLHSGAATFNGILTVNNETYLGLTSSAAKRTIGLFSPRWMSTSADPMANIIDLYQDALAYLMDASSMSFAASPVVNSGTAAMLTRDITPALYMSAPTWNAGASLPLTLTWSSIPNRYGDALNSAGVRIVLYARVSMSPPPVTTCKVEVSDGVSWYDLGTKTLTWVSGLQVIGLAHAVLGPVSPAFAPSGLRLTLAAGAASTLSSQLQLVKIAAHTSMAPWDSYHLAAEPGDQYLFGLPQLRNVADGRRLEFDSTNRRGLGVNSTDELNIYVPSGGTVKVRQDTSAGTVLGRVVTTSGDTAKLSTRRVALHLDPQNQNATGAGNCVWNVMAGGGPAPVRWQAGTTTFKWLAYYGQVPSDFTGSLVIKARLKVVDGGSSQNIQNWQSYLDVYMDGEDNTFSVANPDTFGSTSIGTTWQTVTIKSVSMPGSNGAGSNIYGYFGPGANSVTWGSDLLCGGVWAEYTSAY